MPAENVPLLRHPLEARSAFTAEALMEAVRKQRKLRCEPVPPICILEFDGDLTDWLCATGAARASESWACFHTTMYIVACDDTCYGIVPRTIGGPYAVLIAEQLRASGARVVLGLTSAGRVSESLPVPSLVVATEAIRDEGTSYHYLPAGQTARADAGLAAALANELTALGLTVSEGPVWTTDAPYRETEQQLQQHARAGVLGVEMQAASLFAFAAARSLPVGMVAHITNAVDHEGDPFNKGSHELGARFLQQMCRGARKYLQGRRPA